MLKDKDRKEVENKLKEDEEKPRRAKLTTATVAPTRVASTHTQLTKNKFTQPSTVSPTAYPNYGGVYRDPHVVLPLKPGVNLCFNWNGKDKEVCVVVPFVVV